MLKNPATSLPKPSILRDNARVITTKRLGRFALIGATLSIVMSVAPITNASEGTQISEAENYAAAMAASTNRNLCLDRLQPAVNSAGDLYRSLFQRTPISEKNSGAESDAGHPLGASLVNWQRLQASMSNECQLIFDAEYKLALAAIVAARPIPAPKADNQMQIVISGPDADGITNVGICFTNPSELSGSVTYIIDNSGSGGFLKHSGTPACPSYASGSSGYRFTPGTTYNYSATASNNGKSYSASISYTAPAVDPAVEAARLARVAADEDYRSRENTARASAEAQSLAWNTANPGQQKCFQWGPIVHSNGVSTGSGGVCANPVGTAPTAIATETITTTSLPTTATPTRVETQTSTTTASPTRVETQTSTTTASPTRSDTNTAITIFIPAPTPTASSVETITSTSSPTPVTPTVARPVSSPEIVESDGSEEEPVATLAVTKKSNGKYQIRINSNVAEEQFIITATKKGSKAVTYKATTNDSGDVIILTSRNLSGFTVTLRLNGEYMDKEKIK